MHFGPTSDIRSKSPRRGKEAPDDQPPDDEEGVYWRLTMIGIDTRLRLGRGTAKTETEASEEVFQTLRQNRGHPEKPPLTISDGWGGIREAMVQVWGKVPEYEGRGRPPEKKRPLGGWKYLQKLFGGSGDSGDHQADHRHSDHRLRHFGATLVVPDEAPIAAKPTECALDHPPLRKRTEA